MITGLDFALLAMTDADGAAEQFFDLLLRVAAQPSGPGDADRLAWMLIGTLFRLRESQPDDPIAADLFRALAPMAARRLRSDGYLDGLLALIDIYRATVALAAGAVDRQEGSLRELIGAVGYADGQVRALLSAMCGTLVPATDENFEIRAYLSANLQLKQLLDEHSGFDVHEHFRDYGRVEGRKLKIFGPLPTFGSANGACAPAAEGSRTSRIRVRAASWFTRGTSVRRPAGP